MELEENNQRLPFTNDELLEGYARLEKLRNPPWYKRFWNWLISFFKDLFALIFKKK